jgi:hypothetical protein
MAKEQENPAAMVSSALGIAKVFHASSDAQQSQLSFQSAQSMHDIGRKLLMTVGMENPHDDAIQAAIEANNAFVERLEQIAATSQP